MKRFLALCLVVLLCCVAVPALADTVCRFDRSVTEFFEGDTFQTKLILEGDPATGTVTYKSNALHNGTVDENGLVTGVSKGYVTITATVKTEKRSYKANIQLNVLRKVKELTVKEEQLAVYAPDDPTVAGLLKEPVTDKVLVLRMGRNQTVYANCAPADASNRRYTVESSNADIVRTSGTNLQPRAVGECKVTVSSVQNPEVAVTYHVVVVQPVTQLKVTPSAKSAFVGQTLQMTAVCSPETASIKDVTWSSNNEKIAVVDQSGVVTGVGKGSATIKATAKDGSGRYATTGITIKQQPETIELSESDFIVHLGTYKTLKATVLPKNTNDKSVTWSSSDESVAKVNKSGKVTPVAVGTATITAASKDFPQVSASATVHVHQRVTKITFAEKEIAFHVGSTAQVFWQVEPANATDPTVTFSSNKEQIATVDENGLITGHKRGECYVTATATDGSKKSARIKVIVQQPVEGVHMKNATLSVGVDERITAHAVMEPEDATNTNMTWTSADTSIATVKGSKNKPTITGKRWGTTTITGVTEDGGYTTSATVNVGNYDRALKITDLYLQDNKIKISVLNESNMNISRFYYTICCYDLHDEPIVCHENGGTSFDGSYRYTLYEGDSTRHGKFHFGDFVQPETAIARVTMQLTGYSTDDGYHRDIRDNKQIVVEYTTTDFIGKPEVTEVPAE